MQTPEEPRPALAMLWWVPIRWLLTLAPRQREKRIRRTRRRAPMLLALALQSRGCRTKKPPRLLLTLALQLRGFRTRRPPPMPLALALQSRGCRTKRPPSRLPLMLAPCRKEKRIR